VNGYIYEALTKIFEEVFCCDDIKLFPAMTANDLDGWDSFKHVDIILAVEERFRIKFISKEIDRLANVGDIADAIAQKLANKSSSE
jgi:acyl carrier protein